MSASSLGPAPHPVLAALAAARAALTAAAGSPGWSMSDPEVAEVLEQALAARAQLEAVTAAAVEQADARVLAAELNAPSTGRWLRRRFRLGAREAARLVELSQVLRACPGTGAALAAGTVAPEQAAAIGRAMGDLPPDTGTADRQRAESLLVEQAATLDPDELGRCGRALREALTVRPDEDDPGEAAAVAAEEQRAAAQVAARRLRLTRRRDGMVGIDGLLDPLAGAVVRAALEARIARHCDDDGVRDDRSRPERLADALHELAATAGPAPVDGPAPADDDGDAADGDGDAADGHGESHAEGDTEEGGEGARAERGDPEQPASPQAPLSRRGGGGVRRGGSQVTLLIRWETLQALRPQAGTLEDGTELAPSQLLTALCGASVLPMVFAGSAQPLHLGRRRRLFTPGQHAVLGARDRGCAFPGCTRPPSACTAHHMFDWSARHGPTDVDNGCLLCSFHHALVHREGWQARLSRNGYPEFVPPSGYDPHRRPRQHLRYRTTAHPPPQDMGRAG